MKKYNEWNEIKKQIDNNHFINTKVGEIYNAMLGENVGFEQSGRGEKFLRPVVVFKRFGKETILAIPLSTTLKRGKYYFEFSFRVQTVSVAILTQIKLIDTRRLYKKIGRMQSEQFHNMQEKFNAL
ncbi:MAG: type II toxin-antitoxin system PemK/MazF family toxin [Campylobacterales bacterium]|nr:type II toxin-antitoxin system PemK/MazF family toxin [Campylobacterales bacterium]